MKWNRPKQLSFEILHYKLMRENSKSTGCKYVTFKNGVTPEIV